MHSCLGAVVVVVVVAGDFLLRSCSGADSC